MTTDEAVSEVFRGMEAHMSMENHQPQVVSEPAAPHRLSKRYIGPSFRSSLPPTMTRCSSLAAVSTPMPASLSTRRAVPRLAGGPPRRNPDPVIADKAYSAASNRDLLRRKRIRSVIPQRSDQVANRKKRGRLDGRPPGFDKVEYTRRNVVERAFDTAEHWRAVATRYDKLALTYRAGFTRALIVERLTSSGDTI